MKKGAQRFVVFAIVGALVLSGVLAGVGSMW